MPRSSSSSYIPALDGVRGVAILVVIVYHFAGGFTVFGLQPFRVGWLGVDLFFVLSGFLITSILYDTRSTDGYYKNFYMRRVLRIFPIYYLFWVVLLFLTPLTHFQWTTQHLLYAVYLGNPGVLFWPNLFQFPSVRLGHLWSLAVEEQFYLFWPFMVRVLDTRRRLLTACAIMFIGALLLRTAMCLGYDTAPTSTDILLPCRIDALAIGAALAVLARSPLGPSILRFAPLSAAICGISFALIVAVRHSADQSDIGMATIGFTLLALLFASLIAMTRIKGGASDRLFSNQWLRFFGKISYGLYLYHFALLPSLYRLQDPIVQGLHFRVVALPVYFVACLSACTAVAWLSFTYIERPILSLKSRFEYRLSSAADAVPPRKMTVASTQLTTSGGTTVAQHRLLI